MTALVAGYTRISRVGGRKGDGFISEDDQREGIQRRADELALSIDGWYHDPDYTGGNLQRPEWERLMARIVDPADKLSGVVVVRVDRFARTVPEGAPEVQRIWNAGGVFVAADLPVDTTTDHGRKMLWDWLSNAEFQLGMLKSGWTRTKNRAVKRGAHIGRTPFGYVRVVPEPTRPWHVGMLDAAKLLEGTGKIPSSGCLIPHPEQSEAVRRAYGARKTNASYTDVAALLDDLTPKATRWTVTDVKRLLRNRVYLGEVHYGKTIPPNLTAHDPIVDAATFAAVQATIREGKRKQADTPFLLSGLVRCAHCRYAMAGFSKGGGKGLTPVYRCVSRGNRCDHRPLITATNLEEYVVQAFRAAMRAEQGRTAESHHDEPNPDALQVELDALEAEVVTYMTDATMRQRVGEAAWQAGADARVNARDAKRDELEAAKASSSLAALSRTIDLDDLSREALRPMLPDAIRHIFVRTASRGTPVEGRVRIVNVDDPREFLTPRRGVAGPFPPIPWDDGEGDALNAA